MTHSAPPAAGLLSSIPRSIHATHGNAGRGASCRARIRLGSIAGPLRSRMQFEVGLVNPDRRRAFLGEGEPGTVRVVSEGPKRTRRALDKPPFPRLRVHEVDSGGVRCLVLCAAEAKERRSLVTLS